MMFHFNLHHITLILIGYLSNISSSPLPFGLISSQVSGNGITFSHVELPKIICQNCTVQTRLMTWDNHKFVIIIIIIDIYIAHIAEASKRLETEGGVEMT